MQPAGPSFYSKIQSKIMIRAISIPLFYGSIVEGYCEGSPVAFAKDLTQNAFHLESLALSADEFQASTLSSVKITLTLNTIL